MRRPARVLLAVAALIPAFLFGQAPAPQVEVASVRQVQLPPGGFRFGDDTFVPRIRISGDRVTAQGIFQGLVAAAYNLKMYQVIGAPRWADGRGEQPKYDVAAKSPVDLGDSLEQGRGVLQALLADRFELKFHRELRSLPVYDMVAVKNGPRLRAASDTNLSPRPTLTATGKTLRFRFSNASIADLILSLATALDLPVLDKTGLRGTFDFTLEYDRGIREAASDDSSDDRSIFSAVQSQLGLKLVAAKEPIEVVVIDQAAEPSEN